MSGHGHVVPNANGLKARCGGPGICSVCSKELHAFKDAEIERLRAENLRLLQLDVRQHAERTTVEDNVRLRARVAELEKTLAEANEEADVRDGEGDTLVGQIKMYVQHRHYLASQNITLRKRVAELEAENAKLSEAVTWRPIETAPRDRLIDIWLITGERLACVYYDEICSQWRTSRPSGHLVCVSETMATHWLPLPEAPR